MSHTDHIDEGLLHAYVDGACDADETSAIEAHVAACDACAGLLEQVRAAAAEATSLLGDLEPGPIHAPTFEELEERAAARAGDTGPTERSGGSVGAAPFWRRPALAWAATVVTAFGLGWLTSNEFGLPGDLQPELNRAPMQQFRAQSNEDDSTVDPQPELLDAVTELDAATELGDAPARSAGEAGALNQPISDPVPAGVAPDEVIGEARAQEEAAPPAAAPTPTVEEPEANFMREAVVAPPETAAELARRKAVENAGIVGADAKASRQRPNEGDAAQAAAPPAGAELAESEAQLGQGSYFAATGYVAVQPMEAEIWLGQPLRELPNLLLVRTEVGPGALFADSAVGLPVIRLVYQDATGKEIVLTQQYLGDVSSTPDERLARREIAAGGRADLRSRDSEVAPADRDELVASGFLQTLPVTISEPSGRNIYRWFDGRGYLLSVSGMVDPDILVSLAAQAR